MPAEPQDDAALVDLVDLLGIGETVATGQRAHVDDQPLEDVVDEVRHDPLDPAHLAAVRGVDRQPGFDREVGLGRTEVLHCGGC